MKKLENKRVLITGGTRGIGKAILDYFVEQGARVVFTYASSSETAMAIEKEVAEKGGTAIGIKADAANMQEADAAMAQTIEKLGGIDILINNAGITRDNLLMRMSEEEFDVVVAANLKSVFNYCKAAIKPMMGQRSGRIINISSVVGIIGNAGQTNYVASKAGVIGFTKALAKEVASRNITVNCIAPGFIETDMTGKLNDKQKEAILGLIPLKKMGAGSDIAKGAAFFASDDAGYITGQTLCIDGGMVM